MPEPSPQERAFSAVTLSELLAEFRRPGQPLHRLPQEDAERVFIQVVEQILIKAMRDRERSHTTS